MSGIAHGLVGHGRLRSTVITGAVPNGTSTDATTGAGFPPKAIIYMVSRSTGDSSSWGIGDDADAGYCIYHTAAGASFSSTSLIGRSESAAAHYNSGVLDSLDADGFTITWTKTGTNNVGGTFVAICLG